MKRVSPAGVAAAARVSASRQSVTTSRRSFGSSAYLRRTRRSSARSPLTTMCWAAPLSCSKSTSQIQETSCPSAIRSLRAIKNERAFPNWIAVRRTSLNPVGFLASNRTAGRSPTTVRSIRPNAGVKSRSAAVLFTRGTSSALAAASASTTL